MRISDWSSDVCSSDLSPPLARFPSTGCRVSWIRHLGVIQDYRFNMKPYKIPESVLVVIHTADMEVLMIERAAKARSEERRVGNVCGSTGRSRWSSSHSKKKKLKRNIESNKINN